MPVIPPGEPTPEDNVHPEAKSIIESMKEPIIEFHKEVGGKVKSIHDLLNTVAMTNGKPPFPPQAVAFLLNLKEEQVKQEGGPTCEEDQLLDCFAKLVPKGDTPEIFEEKVISHVKEGVKRVKHANKTFPELEPLLTGLHEKKEGDAEKLYAWFKDLLPEEGKDGFPKEAFMAVVMGVDPKESIIPLKAFLNGIKANMDESDTVEKLSPIISKHME